MNILELPIDILYSIGNFIEKKEKIFYYWVVQVLWKNKYTFLTNDDLVFLMEFFVYYDILSGVKILVRKQNIIPSISCIDTAMHYGRDKYLFVLFKGIGSICEKDGRDLIDNYKWYRFSKEKNERKCYKMLKHFVNLNWN
jgi:sorbitol-specific phosphotransferase system component IIC